MIDVGGTPGMSRVVLGVVAIASASLSMEPSPERLAAAACGGVVWCVEPGGGMQWCTPTMTPQ